ncbi:MAG: hypothetical protein QNJ98_15485 [Planctomycetota bacterium]|nr:hypothetical protein [Planctomycetota bacterium]
MPLRRSPSPTAWIALAAISVALLLPVAAMFGRSFFVYEVELTNGKTYVAAGEITELEEEIRFELPPDDEGRRITVPVLRERLVEVRRVVSLDHYRAVLGDARTLGLLENSLWMAFGGAFAALLFGLPVAWILARIRLPGWRVLGALALGPAVLPPFFIALGGARNIQQVLIAAFDLSGGTLQIVNASIVFGCVLYPFVIVLVGPALAAVPAGPVEAARLLGGRGAAMRRVVWPAVRPSVVGAFVLCFVMAISDFSVPDLLGFMLPAGEQPAHVFATEIRLAWEKHRNYGRAVATGAPFLIVTATLVLTALAFLRKSPVLAAADAGRRRERLAPTPLRLGVGYLVLACVLGVALVMPLLGIASWTSSGESIAGGSNAERQVVEESGSLFQFSEALDATAGIRPQRERWFKMAGAAALLAMLIAAALARAAVRGGRGWRIFAVVAGALPLAVPGIVLSLGTLLFWSELDVEIARRGLLQPVLVLVARFLPFALLASWLALRGVRRGHEEAATLLGAGSTTQTTRIWGPLAMRGILVGGLLVLILALREFESVMLIEPRIYLARVYEKIHFSRLADEANLLFLYIIYVLGPCLGVALLLGLRRKGR